VLLQVLYSIRSKRALMDQIDLHLGFRRDSMNAGNPQFYMTPFGMLRNPYHNITCGI
jgi:hypothetical protein